MKLNVSCPAYNALGYGLIGLMGHVCPGAMGGTCRTNARQHKLDLLAFLNFALMMQNVVTEIARNEAQHVGFLRSALGTSAVACPLVNIGSAFSQAANAAVMSTTFNPAYSPYINDIDFWLASYLLEDVGVSAYKGELKLLTASMLSPG